MSDYIISHIPNTPDRWDEKIGYFDKLIELFKMFFGENMLFCHGRVAGFHRIIATYTIAQGKKEETLAHLEKMTEHTLKADSAKPGDAFTSPFMDVQTYPDPDSDDFDDLTVHNNAYYCREKLNQSRYAPIREEPRFKAICTTLKENTH